MVMLKCGLGASLSRCNIHSSSNPSEYNFLCYFSWLHGSSDMERILIRLPWPSIILLISTFCMKGYI